MHRDRFRQAGAHFAAQRYLRRDDPYAIDVQRGVRLNMESNGQLSPCLSCSRVKDPENCENKNCKLWRQWFSSRWDAVRSNPRLQMEGTSAGLEGVSIGGRSYVLPHRIREYLEKNPCRDCMCPRELCTSPCPARRAWENIKKEVAL